MNVLALINDLQRSAPAVANELELGAQINHAMPHTPYYDNIPLAWLGAVLHLLDEQGYIVSKPTTIIERQDNVFHIKR
jgi:hypothetical protein